MMLQDGVIANAMRAPWAEAVVTSDTRLSYGALDSLANRVARTMMGLGVHSGDRIGLWLDKSAVLVAAMHAALRLNAAYVPVDPLMPADRARIILNDCGVRLLITTRDRAGSLQTAWSTGQGLLTVDGTDWDDVLAQPADPVSTRHNDPGALAFILYTSGSTGIPKGVCISHRNALAFVDWAVAAAALCASDRLANHAPFHFDLSVFDLYGAFAVGACVVLLPETHSFAPVKLVETLLAERISVWYSVPSALILMVERGGLLSGPNIRDLPLRLIFFAGEPFPIHQLRPLRHALRHVRFFNLYGPTETNVCTAFEVHDIAPDRLIPVPIGGGVSGDRVWAVKQTGDIAQIGEEGELIVDGPTVMLGYWGRPGQDDRPYATGDLVRRLEDDCYQYIGRRDSMLKLRGHRIEAGDVEAALMEHPAVQDCAVTIRGDGLDAKLVACIVCPADAPRPGLLAMKAHIALRLPRYMIVDSLCFLDVLPRNRNGKADRRAIHELASRDPRKSEIIHVEPQYRR